MKPIFFTIILVVLHTIVRHLRYLVSFDMDHYWPISIVMPKIPVWQDGITTIAIILFGLLFIREWLQKKRLPVLIGIVCLLTAATNLLQGYHAGFILPTIGISAYDISYWQDMNNISNGIEFLRYYHVLQPTFISPHSQVHPPGALLFYYGLQKLLISPLLISLVIMIVGLASGALLIHLLKPHLNHNSAYLSGFLLMLFPAMNIYSLASLDAIIVTCFLAVFVCWQKNKTVVGLTAAIVLFWLSSFLTFAAVVLIPVLAYDDWRRNHTINKTIILALAVAAIYFGIFQGTGFSYLTSFIHGAGQETAGTLYILRDPLSYFFTRVEDVLEIIVFFGPYLGALWIQGVFHLKPWRQRNQLTTTSLVAVISLVGFFLTGAYFTGETARAAGYIYPFLFILVGFYLNTKKLNTSQELRLLGLVFAQSYLMQLFGWYTW